MAKFLLPDNCFSPECMPIASQLYRYCCGYSVFTVVNMVRLLLLTTLNSLSSRGRKSFTYLQNMLPYDILGLNAVGGARVASTHTSLCFQNVVFQHRFEEIYDFIGRNNITLLSQFHQTQSKSLCSFQTACEKETLKTKERRKNRSGTKIVIRRSKEHKFIWHAEYQHAATFIEDADFATRTSLSARLSPLLCHTAYDVSAQRLCKEIHEPVFASCEEFL